MEEILFIVLFPAFRHPSDIQLLLQPSEHSQYVTGATRHLGDFLRLGPSSHSSDHTDCLIEVWEFVCGQFGVNQHVIHRHFERGSPAHLAEYLGIGDRLKQLLFQLAEATRVTSGATVLYLYRHHGETGGITPGPIYIQSLLPM